MNEDATTITITTPRLWLRPFLPTDAAAMHRTLYSDPAVMRYIPGGVRPPESAEKSITYFLSHWRDHGYGAWAVIHRADNAFIGQGGLNRLTDGKVEVFYTLATAYWGQGLATEIARAALTDGFERVALPEIVGLTFVENVPSRRVLEKLGMDFQGVTDRYYSLPLTYYVLDGPLQSAADALVK